MTISHVGWLLSFLLCSEFNPITCKRSKNSMWAGKWKAVVAGCLESRADKMSYGLQANTAHSLLTIVVTVGLFWELCLLIFIDSYSSFDYVLWQMWIKFGVIRVLWCCTLHFFSLNICWTSLYNSSYHLKCVSW